MQLQLTILAFDTTGTQDSLSLYHKGIMTSKVLPTGGSQLQSSILIPSLQNLLREQKLTFQDVHVLTTVSGPGSFTGIRIGTCNRPRFIDCRKISPCFPNIVRNTCFCCSSKKPSAKILSLIDSKRGDYFFQIFDSNLTPVQAATTISEEDIHQLAEPFVIVSTHPISSLPDIIVPTQSIAELLIEFCLEIALKDDTDRYQTMAPFYIRHPEFKKQKRFVS